MSRIRGEIIKKIKLIVLALFLLSFVVIQSVYPEEQRKELITVDVFGAVVNPNTENFKFHNEDGFGGGGVIAIKLYPYFNLTAFIQISAFPEKSHEEYSPYAIAQRSNVIITSGWGGRFGKIDSDIKLYGEAYLTYNFVDFQSYTNYDKPREVGYLGNKLGVAFGFGGGYKNFSIGYRWINAGGGEIIYSSFFFAVTIPILKQ